MMWPQTQKEARKQSRKRYLIEIQSIVEDIMVDSQTDKALRDDIERRINCTGYSVGFRGKVEKTRTLGY